MCPMLGAQVLLLAAQSPLSPGVRRLLFRWLSADCSECFLARCTLRGVEVANACSAECSYRMCPMLDAQVFDAGRCFAQLHDACRSEC